MRLNIFLAGIIVISCIRCTTPSIIATQSIQKGDTFNNQNRYDEAITHYEEYLKISPQLGVYRNPAMEAEVSRKLAQAYSTQGKYKQAKRYLYEALKTDSAANNQIQMAEDYRLLGLVNGYSGDIHDALEELQKSLQITEGMANSAKNSKRSTLADTHLAIAQVHLTLGNYNETLDHAQAALRIYSTLQDEDVGVSECELLLGIVSRDKGLLEDGEKRILRSQNLALKGNLNVGRQYQALSEISFLKGEIEEAIRFKLKALEEAQRSNITPQVVIALMRLGDAYTQLGDRKKAEDYYQRALVIENEMESKNSTVINQPIPSEKNKALEAYNYYVRSGSSLGKGLVLLRLGVMQEETNVDSALTLLNNGRTELLKAGNKEAIAKANLELAKVSLRANRINESSEFLKEAALLTIQPELKWQISFYHGILWERKGVIDSARFNYEDAIAVIDGMRVNLSVEEFKTLFANSKTEVYDRLILLLLRNAEKWNDLSSIDAIISAFNYTEQARSRTFLDLLGNKKIESRQSSDTVQLANEQLLRLKIQQLVKEISNSGNNLEVQQKFSKDLVETQNEYAELIQKIKLNNPAYATVISVMPPTLTQIQTGLNSNSALLEYWVSNDALVTFIIGHSGIKAKITEVKKSELQRLVTGARNSISMQDMSSTNEIMKKLYDVLIAPVSEELATVKNIVIVPHKTLHFLPFQALPMPDNRFLIEKYVLSYAPSASIFHYCFNKKVGNGKSFLGMALGDAKVGTHAALPGTDIEVNQLTKLYPGSKKRSNEDFLESSFKNDSVQYNYIHIATHGIFNKYQPLYSYLLMNESSTEDGRLTVDEIFGLHVSSKFVTLSACETGLGELGEGDDLVGLSRAFIYAGTPGVIVSLWKVDDATTAWLMTRFYQHILNGNGVAESLTFAQRDLLQHKVEHIELHGDQPVVIDGRIQEAVSGKSLEMVKNPYYWAPFVVIGNGFLQ
jgi:CHAT domain-containing protein/tetratricopeptide (TPR) repeat protein